MEKEEIAARLDHITLPISSLQIQTEVVGCFCPPQEWKTTDELNPNTFTYTVRFMTQQFTNGKIVPRQLTEKQLREQEENSKKKPPAPKKQTKDPAEEERLKKIKEEEAQAEAKRLEEEAKLSEEERLYAVSEDPQRAFSLKYESKVAETNLEGKELGIFQQRVNTDGGEWIYVYKHPSISEEEIAKQKKGKSKNLNLNDLNPVVLRAWVDFSKLREVDVSEISLRCKLSQVEETPETSKPNIEKTYIALKIKLSEPLHKQISPERHITSNDLVLPIPPKAPTPPDIQAVADLQHEIKVILESIAMEFSQSHSKELNASADQKASEPLLPTKQSERTKRVQQFLYEFNVKGMYKIMKERVKKVIVKICKNKFKEELKEYSSFTGITTESKDKFYSQIYSFLISQYQLVLKEIVQQKKQDLYLTNVESVRVHKNDVDKYIKQRINETDQQRVTRLAQENEDLRNLDQAKFIFEDAMTHLAQGEGLDIKFQYVKFCLRNNVVNSSKLVKIVYEVLQGNAEDEEIYLLYTLLLFSSKKKHQYRKGWVFLRELIDKDPTRIQYLMIATLVFQNYLVDEKLAEKYYRLAERVALQKTGILNPLGEHQSNPSQSELPSLKAGCEYNTQLSPDIVDQELYFPAITLFSKYNLFEMLQSVIGKLHNKQYPLAIYTSILIQLNKNVQKALQLALSMNATSPSYLITKLITQITYQSDNYQMCEEHLLKLFKYKQTVGNASTYLQLASLYLRKNQIHNSKACLVKFIESNRNNSLAWLMLGNVELKLNNTQASVDCLREANILNPSNYEVWYSLCEIYLREKKMNIANTCLVNSMSLRRRKEHGFGESLAMYLQSMKYSDKNDQQIAQLMLANLGGVEGAK